ncbi:YraN family protein [Candidatus Falkowbacteria bacterium]|nr:YraN family protein [Candidatus Falkowbacteria bacterium]
MSYTQNIGSLGERLACDYLKNKNYSIQETNYHSKFGEIDIIAKVKQEVDWLVFVEVKSRTNSNSQIFGHPEELVDNIKQGKITSTISHYLNKKNINPPNWRLDVIAIDINPKTRKARIHHYENI